MTPISELFAELENRADAWSAFGDNLVGVGSDRHPHAPQRRPRLFLAAASAAVVVAAVTATALAAGALSGGESGQAPAGGSLSAAAAAPEPGAYTIADVEKRLPEIIPSQVHVTITSAIVGHEMDGGISFITPPPDGPSRGAGASCHGGSSEVAVAPCPSPSADTSPPTHTGAEIGGQMTGPAGRGGYALLVVQMPRGHNPGCGATTSGDGVVPCTSTRLADGSLLQQGAERLADGVAYRTVITRPNGLEILLNLSNHESPIGRGRKLSDQPPLTLMQMRAIVTSSRWYSA